MKTVREICERVRATVARAGADPWLVGYDVNGIQDLVTASSRPIAMYGASFAIKRFDRGSTGATLSVFAGGGRGVELARSEEDAKKRAADIERRFREETCSGVVATVTAPYRAEAARESLAWFRRKLENAKDAAPRPGGVLPTNKEALCDDCESLAVDPELPVDEKRERRCARCERFVRLAREQQKSAKGGEKVSKSLLDLARDRRIAAISADGNDLGSLFRRLETLEHLAVASEVVAGVFERANGDARRAAIDAIDAIAREHPLATNEDREHLVLAPVTGGDDIRAFLAPSGVLPYVTALARAIEEGARDLRDLGGVLPDDVTTRLQTIRVGVGAVIAGDHYPASRLMDHAHTLERSAKVLSGERGERDAPRSAFDFAVLDTGEIRADAERPPPLSLETTAWAATLKSARALRSVPSAQRALVADRPRPGAPGAEEFENMFAYQVARSKAWQKWLDACGVEWTDRGAIQRHLAGARLDLVELVGPESSTKGAP